MTPEDAFLAELSRQIDECMRKIGEPRWLIANPPPAPASDRRACKAWCGHLTWHLRLDDPARMGRPQFEGCSAELHPSAPVWCSPACRAANLPPLEAKAACQPWCGRALPDDGVAVYGFIDGPGDEREFFKLSGATCRRKGYVLGWCSMECRDRAARPAETKLDWYYKPRCCGAKLGPFANSEESSAAGRAHENACAERAHLAQPAQSKPLTARDVKGGPVAADSKFTDETPVKFSAHRCGPTCCMGCIYRDAPAEQPAPAKFEPPKCDRCPSTDGVRGHPVDGRYQYMCPPCIAAAVAWFSVQPGKSYKGPALIDRRLTHSPMWPDDDGGA